MSDDLTWTKDDMVQIILKEPDDFLKVRETLTRIGVASKKELFALDSKKANLSTNDIQRRNRIIQLLFDWGLVEVANSDQIVDAAPLSQIKVISYKDKGDWTLESKYNIGKKRQGDNRNGNPSGEEVAAS